MMDEKTARIYDAIETIKMYIKLAMGYIDAHEEMNRIEPIVMVFDKIEKEINIIDENYDK